MQMSPFMNQHGFYVNKQKVSNNEEFLEDGSLWLDECGSAPFITITYCFHLQKWLIPACDLCKNPFALISLSSMAGNANWINTSGFSTRLILINANSIQEPHSAWNIKMTISYALLLTDSARQGNKIYFFEVCNAAHMLKRSVRVSNAPEHEVLCVALRVMGYLAVM